MGNDSVLLEVDDIEELVVYFSTFRTIPKGQVLRFLIREHEIMKSTAGYVERSIGKFYTDVSVAEIDGCLEVRL